MERKILLLKNKSEFYLFTQVKADEDHKLAVKQLKDLENKQWRTQGVRASACAHPFGPGNDFFSVVLRAIFLIFSTMRAFFQFIETKARIN